MQKHTANAMPTNERALDLFSGVVTSERIALLWVNDRYAVIHE